MYMPSMRINEFLLAFHLIPFQYSGGNAVSYITVSFGLHTEKSKE